MRTGIAAYNSPLPADKSLFHLPTVSREVLGLWERGEAKGEGVGAAEDQRGAAAQLGAAGQPALQGLVLGLMATPLGQELSRKDNVIPSAVSSGAFISTQACHRAGLSVEVPGMGASKPPRATGRAGCTNTCFGQGRGWMEALGFVPRVLWRKQSSTEISPCSWKPL